MNICLITSGHDPFDDRIFYHMAKTLNRYCHKVTIISSKRQLNEVADGIEFNCFPGDDLTKRNKIIQFNARLEAINADLIICSEPLTILAAKNYKKRQNRKIKIVYDVTEWYPSKKNLYGHKFPSRWYIFLKLIFFNLWASGIADSFIFGEYYKSKPYRILYPRKPYIFISYYPETEYIPVSEPHLDKGRLRLSYSGKISLEKGYANFFNVLHKLGQSRKDLQFDVKIIGWYETARDKTDCENLFSSVRGNISLKISEKQDFKEFIELIKETDIFMDLRSDDFENQHCLPVKLFYYAALGRPVIISDLKAVRKEVEIGKFGFLVKPENSELIADLISEYLNNEELYYKHCGEAKKLAESSYNWKKIEAEFISFLALA